jgi:hypothetical protein
MDTNNSDEITFFVIGSLELSEWTAAIGLDYTKIKRAPK